MKVVSFNINGLRARLPQLQALIDTHQPDIIGLQEIKVHDDAFPRQEVEAMGYHVYFHGTKAHYGLPMCKQPPVSVSQRGFPDDDDEAQRRLIRARFELRDGQILTVMNGYSQGESRDHPTKFPAKEKILRRSAAPSGNRATQPQESLIVMGDLNIPPAESDIGIGDRQPQALAARFGKCSFLPEEREWLARLQQWGTARQFLRLAPGGDGSFQLV